MNAKFILYPLSFILFLCLPVQAQEEPTHDLYLTLTEAINISLENSHDLKVAQQQIEDAKLQVQENTAQGLPQLTASAGYNRQDPVANFGNSGGSSSGLGTNPQFAAFLGLSSVNRFNGSLTLSQLIFAGFRVIDGIRLAQINVDLMHKAQDQTRQEVVSQVTDAYFNALRIWQMVQVDEDALKQAQAHIHIAQKKVEAGVGIRFDVLQAENRVISVQQSLSKDRNDLLRSKTRLNLVMGRKADEPIVLNPSAKVQNIPLVLEEGAQYAIDKRPDIQQIRLRKEISDLNATIQSRANWPTLTFSTSYNIQDNQVVDGNVSNNQNLTYGLNMNWPIFDGLQAISKSQRAKNSAQQQQIQLDKLRQRIIAEVKQAFLDVQEAQERILMAKQGVQVAEEGLRLAEISYREGVGTSINVLDAQISLTQAKMALITAEYDLNTSMANLYKVTGLPIQ